jgi:hypothetical protein
MIYQSHYGEDSGNEGVSPNKHLLPELWTWPWTRTRPMTRPEPRPRTWQGQGPEERKLLRTQCNDDDLPTPWRETATAITTTPRAPATKPKILPPRDPPPPKKHRSVGQRRRKRELQRENKLVQKDETQFKNQINNMNNMNTYIDNKCIQRYIFISNDNTPKVAD